ncbi:predicted protein [Postia placenta Mad-698-R]|nr:predicted protein [Postia placenta Mad-698-R]
MFMENTNSVKPAHPEIRRGRVPQTAWRIETVSRLPTAPQLPVDTIFFTHKNQTNGCGVPLRDLIACPPRQVDETIGENMAGGSDEVFAAVEYKSITINVQWPSYDFVYNENVPIVNRGKYITRAQLAISLERYEKYTEQARDQPPKMSLYAGGSISGMLPRENEMPASTSRKGNLLTVSILGMSDEIECEDPPSICMYTEGVMKYELPWCTRRNRLRIYHQIKVSRPMQPTAPSAIVTISDSLTDEDGVVVEAASGEELLAIYEDDVELFSAGGQTGDPNTKIHINEVVKALLRSIRCFVVAGEWQRRRIKFAPVAIRPLDASVVLVVRFTSQIEVRSAAYENGVASQGECKKQRGALDKDYRWTIYQSMSGSMTGLRLQRSTMLKYDYSDLDTLCA